MVDLAGARDGRRLRDYQGRLFSVSETNRKALSQLFGSGLIFTRAGARLGRDLLLAHQHLLRVKDLLDRLEELSAGGSPAEGAAGAGAEAIYAQVHALLSRTSELSARSDGLLAREH